ncbi:serine hydrolase [Oenococcus oeni]|uniref:serine hydrolase n=2 Tax=Oenococcus oeni TaxID=1247 RepID=UPI00050F3437|nr:serine hydrolase [Oenococcus oeni]KGH99587.1 beta-lactamase [Oenococcus oeni IOEB_1491]KGI06669.1 beta-lactamase [Oenococcus oeni S19]OIM05051.1 serine hydrolase [Oenococcus oeni]
MAISFNEVSQEIEDILKSLDKQLQLSFYLSNSENCFSFHGNRVMPSASLIKLTIADYYCSNFSLADLQKQTQKISQGVGGSGVIQILDQKVLSLSDLISMMLSLSDNTAANTLIDIVGLNSLSVWIKGHYSATSLSRKFMDFSQKKDNLTDANDAAHALRRLIEFPLTKRALLKQQSTNKFELNFVESNNQKIYFYNKTGEGSGIDHDAIIFRYQNRQILAVLMTKYDPAIESRLEIINLFSEIGDLLKESIL